MVQSLAEVSLLGLANEVKIVCEWFSKVKLRLWRHCGYMALHSWPTRVPSKIKADSDLERVQVTLRCRIACIAGTAIDRFDLVITTVMRAAMLR